MLFFVSINLNSFYRPPDPVVSSLFRDKGEPGREFSSCATKPAAPEGLRAPLARKKALFGC